MSKYFKIKDAWAEVKKSNGFLDTSLAVSKLVGKGVSNTVVYTFTEAIPEMMERKEKELSKDLKRSDLSSDVRAKKEADYLKIQDYKENNQETLDKWKADKEERRKASREDRG